MRYRPKSIAALHIALGGLPNKMRVEVDPDLGVSAKTVGELRKLMAWPENLAITTPQERHPDSAVKITKAIVKGRVFAETVRRFKIASVSCHCDGNLTALWLALSETDSKRAMRVAAGRNYAENEA